MAEEQGGQCGQERQLIKDRETGRGQAAKLGSHPKGDRNPLESSQHRRDRISPKFLKDGSGYSVENDQQGAQMEKQGDVRSWAAGVRARVGGSRDMRGLGEGSTLEVDSAGLADRYEGCGKQTFGHRSADT